MSLHFLFFLSSTRPNSETDLSPPSSPPSSLLLHPSSFTFFLPPLSAYGQVKSVRLPRKFDTKARGFAFLDFISRRDAEAAMLALRHTHLLGRHLILEWAEEETDIEKLREDAKDVVRAKEEGGMKAGKKSKITLL